MADSYKSLCRNPRSVARERYGSGGSTGLYANIHAKRERIAAGSGEKMRKPGSEGAPTEGAFEKAKKTKRLDRRSRGGKTDKAKLACNEPHRTPNHPSKSHIVKACEGGTEKIIRFGQQGVSGSPRKEGESESYRKRRESFKARHAKNIAKGRMSAAYWADKVKWTIILIGAMYLLYPGDAHAQFQQKIHSGLPSLSQTKASEK